MSRSSKVKEYVLPVNYNELDISEKRIVREQYMKQQNNKCYWCNEDLTKEPPMKITNKTIDWKFFPINFLKSAIHLQHNHTTNMTEGAVHSYCNAVMWQYHNR